MFVSAEETFGGSGADIVVPGAGVYEPVSICQPSSYGSDL